MQTAHKVVSPRRHAATNHLGKCKLDKQNLELEARHEKDLLFQVPL